MADDWVFMQIFINRMVSGKIITLDVEASNAIKDVKAQICNFEGIPANQQRLIFNERRLEKDRTLSEYHIQNKSTLILLIVDDCCRGCENSSPVAITACTRSCEVVNPCVNSVCFPDSKNIDEFNLCSKKLDTLLFCIFQSAQLAARCDKLLVNPERWKSVACVREVLMDHFKGLELSETEGIQLRQMIPIVNCFRKHSCSFVALGVHVATAAPSPQPMLTHEPLISR